MVGFGAARLEAAQARILESWRSSSCANAASKNFACRCQEGSRVNGSNGESADGIIPARNSAVSLAVTTSALRAGSAAASSMAAATTAIFVN